MSAPESTDPTASAPPQPVKFITKEDSAFRISHADGAWGMVTNTGNIQLNFFVEHPPLPETVIYRPDGSGRMQITSPSDVTGKMADDENFCVIRSYQSAIVMSLDVAKNIQMVLANFIAMTERLNKGESQNE